MKASPDVLAELFLQCGYSNCSGGEEEDFQSTVQPITCKTLEELCEE